jgi:hypothetical protein
MEQKTMKSTYSKKITILIASVAVIAISVYLFFPKDTKVPQTIQPIPASQAKDQPVQVTETIQEPANSSELTKDFMVQSETEPSVICLQFSALSLLCPVNPVILSKKQCQSVLIRV